MRNLVYLNGDGMVNVHPKKDTVQINDEYYCEMTEQEFTDYTETHALVCINGELLDSEDLYKYGTVLVTSK